MGYMKRWLEDCSEELGHDGEINDEVLAQASPTTCPRAWQRAMDRAPRPNADMAAYELSYLEACLSEFTDLVQRMRLVQEACFCNENRYDERRRLEAKVDQHIKRLRAGLVPVAPVDADDEMPF
jgi:hypothetical protein